MKPYRIVVWLPYAACVMSRLVHVWSLRPPAHNICNAENGPCSLSIGHSEKWHPISFEAEFWNPDFRNSSCTEVGSKVLQAIQEVPDLHSTRLHELHFKSDRDLVDNITLWDHWVWEPESYIPGMCEISSPIELLEGEAELAIAAAVNVAGQFQVGPMRGEFHVNVEARCLLEDERLSALLLIWEKHHAAIRTLVLKNCGDAFRCQMERYGTDFSARSLAESNYGLVAHLQNRWETRRIIPNETLTEHIRRIGEPFVPVQSTVPKHNQGWRDFAINVCHLLDIPCCRDCFKNDVPKFGSLEFRIFYGNFDESSDGHSLKKSFRLFVALAERLVQATCERPTSELTPFMLLQGVTAAPDLTSLVEFLQFDPNDFLIIQ